MEKLTEYAGQRKLSLFEALRGIEFVPGLNATSRKRLSVFLELVEEMRGAIQGLGAGPAMTAVLERSGLVAELETEDTEEAQARIENLQELVTAAVEFDRTATPASTETDSEGETGPLEVEREPLSAFLEQTALLGEADVAGSGGQVSMMTLHAAKGLEFDCVFLTGMEENVFPHSRATGEGADPEELAEERRLCYVGITRARHRLFFSMAQSRTTFGELRFNRPSRFLAEIPRELFGFGARPDQVDAFDPEEPAPRPARQSTPPPKGVHVVYDEEFAPPPFESGGNSRVPRRRGPRADQLGDRVMHEAFGEGLVRHRDGTGDDATVSVQFATVGLKKIKARYLRPC